LSPGSVLSLHGFLGHAEALSSLELDRLVEASACPLLLGHGRQPEPPSPSFDAEVERLLALAETLPHPRRLLGYSQGARLGLGLLLRRPGLFQQALLVAAQPGCATAAERHERRALEDVWIAEIEDHGARAFIDRFSALSLFGPPRPAAELLQRQPWRWEHTQAGLVSALLVLGTSQMPNFWPALSTIDCPVELWVGSLDEKFCRIAQQMRDLMPAASVRTFEGSYHNPIMDAPNAARAAVQAWLCP